ncbi:MAG TPA: VanZ family protein [Bryobacteraceae bacterium]|nr:VanZ family protein [Bryobacteraceae bacterium]
MPVKLENSQPLRLSLLPLSIAAIAATTMIPVALRRPSLTFVDISITRSDVLNNLLLYLPLGVSLVGRGFGTCVATAAGVSVLAELLQFGQVNRSPSPVDVACNIAGGLIGFLLARLLQKLIGFSLESISFNRPIAALCLAVAGTSIFALAWHRTRTDFSNWDRSFPLFIGKNAAGDRPWQGTIERLAIFAQAASSTTIREFAESGPAAVGYGNVLPPAIVDWPNRGGAPHQCAGRFSELPEDGHWFKSLQKAGELTILAWIAPANISQRGPVRIVTSSHDEYSCNLMLGQIARSLTFRLRTPNTGGNGMNPALYTRPVLVANRPSFIAVTYNGSKSQLYVDGGLVARTNLAERRPRFPQRVVRLLPPLMPIRDLEINVCEIVIGALTTIGILGLFRIPLAPPRRSWLLSAAAGSVCGALIWIACVSEPRLGLRVFFLSLAGALLVPYARYGASSNKSSSGL